MELAPRNLSVPAALILAVASIGILQSACSSGNGTTTGLNPSIALTVAPSSGSAPQGGSTATVAGKQLTIKAFLTTAQANVTIAEVGLLTLVSGGVLLARGVLMPAHPKAGDKFMSEDVPKITWEKDAVVSIAETVTVPAGTFSNCVKIKETASDGDIEVKFYAPGVGCIEEIEGTTGLPLKSHVPK